MTAAAVVIKIKVVLLNEEAYGENEFDPFLIWRK
jgi:hypothetical protein